jgi:flagellar hook-associated protein 1 FlgK
MAAELDLAAAHLASRFEAQGLRLFTDGAGGVPDVAGPYAGSAMIGFAGAIRVNPAVMADPRLVRDGTHDVAATPGGPAPSRQPGGRPRGVRDAGRPAARLRAGPGPGAGLGAAAHPGGRPRARRATDSGLSGHRTLESLWRGAVAEHGAVRAAAEGRGRGARRRCATCCGNAWRNARRGTWMRRWAAMIQLQTAYGVNARVVATVQAMWDALLGAVR